MIYDFTYSSSSLKVLGSVNHGLIGHCWMFFATLSHSHIVFLDGVQLYTTISQVINIKNSLNFEGYIATRFDNGLVCWAIMF
jgi:hypothetical protein